MTRKNLDKNAIIPDKHYKNRKPWERAKYEPEAAFKYFAIYKDMGPDRSISKLQKVVGIKHPNFLFVMSSKWNWQERVREWDNEIQNIKNDAIFKAVEEMNKRHAKMAVGALIPLAIVIQKYNAALEIPENLNNLAFKELHDMYIEIVKVMPNIVNVERKARGEATEITKNNITSNEAVKIILPPNEAEENMENESNYADEYDIVDNDKQNNLLNK